MVVFSRSLRVLTVSDKLRLFFALAITFCVGLLFLVLASVWFGADISAARATEESILVRDVNVRNALDRQDDPEDEFQIEFTNEVAYEAANPPQITIEGFVFIEEDGGEEDSNLWEPVEAGADVDHSADAWVSGSDSLSDLAEGAVNELDFVVDVPLGTENGSYTAAVVIRDQDSELLDYRLIVINVGLPGKEGGSRYDLELSEKSFDLEDAGVRVVITNESLWHVSGSMELRLKDSDDAELMVSLLPESDFPLALFPRFEKAWILENQSISEVKAFVEEKEDFDAELVFLASQAAGETEATVAASWDVKTDISLEATDGDDDSEEEGASATQPQAGEGEQATTASSDGNFLTDNLIPLVGAGGVLVVILLAVLLIARRRRAPAKIASPPAHSAVTPQPKQGHPPDSAAVPEAKTDVVGSDSSSSGMPVAEEPAGDNMGSLENLPSAETVQDLSLPTPELPNHVNKEVDTAIPPANNPPAQDAAIPLANNSFPSQDAVSEEEPSVQLPVLEGMPQLPPLEDVVSPPRPEIPADVLPSEETTPPVADDSGGNPPQTPSAEDSQQPPAAAI